MAGELPPSRVLLVEGVDDKHVVRHFCGRHADMPAFDIIDKSGFPNLRRAIGPEIKVSGRNAMGILVDGNRHPARRWEAIVHQLRQAGFQPPAQVEPTGTIIEGRPRVGVWLMPDNRSAGELEDFIARLLPPGDPVWPRAQRYIDDIPPGQRKFAPDKVLRASIHAWLAARAEPRKMGVAVGAGDLHVTGTLAMQFSDWLRRLFD